MKAFHTLETQRTLIRRFAPEDEAHFIALLGDRRITSTLAFDEETTTERGSKHLMQLTISLYETENPLLAFAIDEKASQQFIGACGYNSLNEEEAELFYALITDWWGQGIATEIVAELARYAFEHLPFTTLKAFITPDNEGSKRVAEKNGFENAGLVKNPNFSELVYLYQKTR
uniref:GNAT family N-acetyltransferase n=1 Tax=Roseihalotalea indica TaxID=2867963 RepID=A0AA49JBU7_9BACT|nr:GNAT family N-acetyltransferase [Tunicatimonas sp. TK19036]